MELKTLYVPAGSSLSSKSGSRLAVAARKSGADTINNKFGLLILAHAFVSARGGFSFAHPTSHSCPKRRPLKQPGRLTAVRFCPGPARGIGARMANSPWAAHAIDPGKHLALDTDVLLDGV